MNLTYTIQRSAKRHKLTITVERDRSVIVHAPTSMSEAEIEHIVHAKRLWIFEKVGHTQKYQDLPHPPGKEIVSGESALYLGRQYRIDIVEADLSEIHFTQRFLIPKGLPPSARSGALQAWYRARAQEKIVPRVTYHARHLGVNVASIKIVDNRYRWGSCTPNDTIHINWRLIKAPIFVIDYIIIHELAHLLETNHTPRFWTIIRTQTPTMDKAKTWLKKHGQILEELI